MENDKALTVQELYKQKVRMVNRILSQLSCGVVLLDPETKELLYFNQKALDLCGVSSEAELSASIDVFLTDADVSEYSFEGRKLLQAVFSGKKEAEIPGGPSDGGDKSSEASAETDIPNIISSMAGEYSCIYWFDIKDPVMVPVKRGETEDFSGMAYSDMLGRFLDAFCHEDDRESARQMLDLPQVLTAVSYNGRHEFSVRVKNSSGLSEYMKIKFLPLDGGRKLLLCVADVSDAALKELRQQENLRIALEAANAANAAKTNFLSNMSHDIRTPMNAITGFTDLALQNIDNREKTLDYLNKISDSGRHLLNLINDVLDMSRIESGKMHISEEKADILDVFDSLCDMIKGDIAKKGLKLNVVKECSGKTAVYCDVLRLKQLLLNLLSNAIKFTPAGGSVTFGVKDRSYTLFGSGGFEFTVEDTGIGIAPEFIDKLFVPFERERTSTISGIQGTGLGMSICKSITDLMGGSIDVQSELGKGTRFTVDLVFRLVDEAPAAAVPVAERPIDLTGLRILLVEDNEFNREIATELLTAKGVLMECAENGLEAVNRMKSVSPDYFDLILMDVQMPVMDGYTAAMEIRALSDPDKAAIPIIAMTANAFAEDRRNALLAGMNDHIAKPINVDVLTRSIARLVFGD